MKSRKNTINGKVIVTGDVNELEAHEVLINEKLNEDGTIQLDIKEIGEDGSVRELTPGGKESDDSWGTFLIVNLGGTVTNIVLKENESLVFGPTIYSCDLDFYVGDQGLCTRKDNIVTLSVAYRTGEDTRFVLIPKKEIKIKFLYDGSYNGDVPVGWDGETVFTDDSSLDVSNSVVEYINSFTIYDTSDKELLKIQIN